MSGDERGQAEAERQDMTSSDCQIAALHRAGEKNNSKPCASAHVVEGGAGRVAGGGGDVRVGHARAGGGVLGAVGGGLGDLLGGEVDGVLVTAGLADLFVCWFRGVSIEV